jgi:hypothetical protein
MPHDPQLALFGGFTSSAGPQQGLAVHLVPALAEGPAPVVPCVPAPREMMLALDEQLATAGPPVAPDLPPPPALHRPASLPSVRAAELAAARQAAAAEALARLIAEAELDREELAVVRRLEAAVLPDDRLWLEVLVAACRAEATEPGDVAAILKESLRRTHHRGERPPPRGMLARSRCFWELRQANPAPTFTRIAEVWCCPDHTVALYGFTKHQKRRNREWAAAHNLGESAPSPAVEALRRHVVRDAAPPAADDDELSSRRAG